MNNTNENTQVEVLETKTIGRNLTVVRKLATQNGHTIAYETLVRVAAQSLSGEQTEIVRQFICFHADLSRDNGWKYLPKGKKRAKSQYKAHAMHEMENDVAHYVRLYRID